MSQQRYKTILLFGAPGAGKGTQGHILGAVPGFFHLACGDVFRSMDLKSELGKIFYEYSSRGQLVPDDVTVRMWCEVMAGQTAARKYDPLQDLLVLDGIPRTAEQARIMDQHIEVLRVIHLVCRDEQAMFARMRRRALKDNRFDDADERVIRRRWRVYEEETMRVLEHYPAALIAEVDSMASPIGVLREVVDIVAPIYEQAFAPESQGASAK